MMLTWKQFKYHKTQQELWKCTDRFAAVWAGRGSGKTDLAKRKLILSLPLVKDWPDPRYFYGAPTEAQAKRIAWQDLLDWIPPEWVKDVNASQLRIRTIFGSTLYIIGLDKPQRIEGIQWDGCVIDESCDIRPGTFNLNVVPALTWREGWCWRIGVPKRQGIGAPEFRKYCMKAQSGELDDTSGFTWPSSEVVPKSLLRYAQKTLDAKDYGEQFDAKFQTAGGGIFHSFDPEYSVRPCSYQASKPIIIGSDFNVDPMCWVIGHRWDNRIEWIDELFIRDTNTVTTLEILYQKYQHHRSGFEFYGDATGQSRKTSASESDYRQIANHHGFKKLSRTVHYPRANPSIDDRFAACNALLCNAAGRRRMFADPRCERLIEDLESRTFKPGTRIPGDYGDVGHMTDAMGYPVHTLFPIHLEIDWRPATVVATTGE